MPSKQFDHLQESSAARLRALIPASCPLVVERQPRGGFHVFTLDTRDEATGRYQVVAAFILGYVAAWRRASPRASPQPQGI